MRVALLSTYDDRGGAARAALRLHRALPAAGVESRMLVQRRFGDEPGVEGPRGGLAGGLAGVVAEWRPRLESIPVRRYPGRRPGLFSPAFLPDGTLSRIERLAPDLVHLHWVGFGFVRPETLPRIRRPVVWTMHDSWPFTGGCHVPAECVRYRESCGRCPALGSDRDDDLSRRVFERKRIAWRDRPFRLVAPSRWLAEAARSSALLGDTPIDVIPNGLDLRRFCPRDPADARAELGLSPEARIILFSGMDAGEDPNKGLSLLVEAMKRVAEWMRSRKPAPQVLLFVPGAGRTGAGLHAMTGFGGIDPSLPVLGAGHVDDEERFALHVAAADLLVLPSRLENQPNLVLEAMACARPVVAFRASGLPELVAHQETGYLAEPYDAHDLGAGIVSLLEDRERARAMGERARARAEQLYGADLAARRYRDLYREILGRDTGPAASGPGPRSS